MTKKEFIELVYNYGADGTKVFDELDLKDAQKEDIAMAWSEFDNYDDTDELDEAIGSYFAGFELDGKWYVNYNDKDLEGYYTGSNSGMIDFENKGIANSEEYALSFDTKEDAEKWCREHKEEWLNGDLSVF